MATVKKKVLIIDDSKETRELISELLQGEEFDPIMAPGGREGIQLGKLRQPDIILLDMEMPIMDGVSTCRTLKKLRQTQKIPVIFLTANRDEKTIKQAIAAGGQDYIVKPFDPENLKERMRRLLAQTGFNPESVIRT